MITIWVVYDHPSDYPDMYVAREWVDGKPTANFITAVNYEMVRWFMEQMSLVRLERSPEDDPTIMESWI